MSIITTYALCSLELKKIKAFYVICFPRPSLALYSSISWKAEQHIEKVPPFRFCDVLGAVYLRQSTKEVLDFHFNSWPGPHKSSCLHLTCSEWGAAWEFFQANRWTGNSLSFRGALCFSLLMDWDFFTSHAASPWGTSRCLIKDILLPIKVVITARWGDAHGKDPSPDSKENPFPFNSPSHWSNLRTCELWKETQNIRILKEIQSLLLQSLPVQMRKLKHREGKPLKKVWGIRSQQTSTVNGQIVHVVGFEA